VVLALVIGAVLLVSLIAGIHVAASRGSFAANEAPVEQAYPVDRLGQVLLGDYLVPFEIVSVLLLVVMIGAAYLAKARRKET
jgi:NADH-quinone oxidoreductase subunit J